MLRRIAPIVALVASCRPPIPSEPADPPKLPLVVFRSPTLSDVPEVLAEGPVERIAVDGVFMNPPIAAGRNPVRRWVERHTLRVPGRGIFYTSPRFEIVLGESLAFEAPPRLEFEWAAVGFGLLSLALLAAGRRRPWAWPVALGSGSVALSFWQAAGLGHYAIFAGDEALYVSWAQQASRLEALTQQGSGIGWPLLLAPFFRLFGISEDPSLAAYQVGPALVVAGGLLPILVFWLARDWSGNRGAGWVAAIVVICWAQWARHPFVGWPPDPHVGRTVFVPMAWTEGPWVLDIYYFSQRVGLTLLSDLPALVVVAGGALLSIQARRGWSWLAAGLLSGFAVTMRPAAGFCLLPIGALVMGYLRTPDSSVPSPQLGPIRRVAIFAAGLGLGYLPQAGAMWAWTGSPFTMVTEINTLYLRERVMPEWSLSRAFDLGLGFHGGYHASLVALGAAGSFAAAARGGARSAIILTLGALAIYLPIASFGFCCNQPDRYVWPAILWLALAISTTEVRPTVAGGISIMAILGLCPGLPIDGRLELLIPAYVYQAAPVVVILSAAALALRGRMERLAAVSYAVAVLVATLGAKRPMLLWGAFVVAPFAGIAARFLIRWRSGGQRGRNS